MNGIPWNEEIVSEFFEKACLTDTEKEVIRARINGWTRVKMSLELHMSVSTVDKIIKRAMEKYDNCRGISKILPERQKSIKNIYE